MSVHLVVFGTFIGGEQLCLMREPFVKLCSFSVSCASFGGTDGRSKDEIGVGGRGLKAFRYN